MNFALKLILATKLLSAKVTTRAAFTSVKLPTSLLNSHSFQFQHVIPQREHGERSLFSAAPSSPRSFRNKKSAFGKASIGKNKRQGGLQQEKIEKSKSNFSSSVSAIDKRTLNSAKTIKYAPPPTIDFIDGSHDHNATSLHDRFEQARATLKKHTKLPLQVCDNILSSHPRLYTNASHNQLSSQLLYLRNELCLKPRHIRQMITAHPGLMETVLLDNRSNLASTFEVLQTELGLSPTDVEAIRSSSVVPTILSYPRSELRKRIQVYKNELHYQPEQIRTLVQIDPRVLRTNTSRVRKALHIFHEELGISVNDVREMLDRDILLLTYRPEENLRPTVMYLKEGKVGLCLGIVAKKGESTLNAGLEKAEREEIVRVRLKNLVMRNPKILSSSVEQKLKQTVEYFLTEGERGVGMTEYEFGKILYRRGGGVLEANLETLKRKIGFIRKELNLEWIKNEVDGNHREGHQDDDVVIEYTTLPSMSSSKINIPLPPLNNVSNNQPTASTITNTERQRLLAQMIATNPDFLTFSIEKNLSPKFDYFRNIVGMTDEQLRYVILKRPQVLSLNLERNIVPKIKFFTDSRKKGNTKQCDDSNSGGFGLTMEETKSWIVEYPQILPCPLETRIKPRIREAVEHDLFLGKNLPGNFVFRSESSWRTLLQKR